MKTCSKCRKTKAYSEFHKDVSRNDGHRSRCKACLASVNYPRSTEPKVCSACGIQKPADEFASHRRSPDGLDHRCRPCHRVYKQRRWHSPETREHELRLRREQARRYYANNREAYLERQRRASRVRYRWLNVLGTEQDWLCAICGRRMLFTSKRFGWRPSIDHIVPRSQGGNDSRDNLQAVHQMCNATKAIHTVADAKRRLLNEERPAGVSHSQPALHLRDAT